MRHAPADVSRVVTEAGGAECPCCEHVAEAGEVVIRLRIPGFELDVCIACARESTDRLVRALAN